LLFAIADWWDLRKSGRRVLTCQRLSPQSALWKLGPPEPPRGTVTASSKTTTPVSPWTARFRYLIHTTFFYLTKLRTNFLLRLFTYIFLIPPRGMASLFYLTRSDAWTCADRNINVITQLAVHLQQTLCHCPLCSYCDCFEFSFCFVRLVQHTQKAAEGTQLDQYLHTVEWRINDNFYGAYINWKWNSSKLRFVLNYGWRSGGQSLLVSGHHTFEPITRFFFLFIRKFLDFKVVLPLWREDGTVISIAINLWSGSLRTHSHTLLSHSWLVQLYACALGYLPVGYNVS
jgi:hypothetical protein